MRRNIRIANTRTEQAGGHASAIEISFQHVDPSKAEAITRDLLASLSRAGKAVSVALTTVRPNYLGMFIAGLSMGSVAKWLGLLLVRPKN